MAEINDQVVRPWQYSIKVEVNAKGYLQPSVHVYSDSLIDGDIEIQELVLHMLSKLVRDAKALGFKVATDIDTEKLV